MLTLATYLAPKYLLLDKLEETLEELKTREAETKPYRARLAVVGSEVDDSGFIKLIEDTGAYVCADRFCFGSLPGRNVIELNDGVVSSRTPIPPRKPENTGMPTAPSSR